MSEAGRVAVLPDALANQIAAGEVVERPVSVVKELVENALDAEAGAITVEVEDGGKQLVRIVDDGVGMARADAVRALGRHATSKIRASEDLRAIETLGFRGEALPAIASVSRFRLVTRRPDDAEGTEVRVDEDGTPRPHEAGAPVGTTVEARDLFHNVPARRKFLKRSATELGHVKDVVTAAALGNPHVHLKLRHGGRTVADHPVAPDLRQRIFQVLGRRTSQRLYAVELDDDVVVRGYIAEPTFHRANPNGLYLFVNGRRIRDRTIVHGVVSAYGSLLERGRFPHGVLYIHLPPHEVDVNVHPTKAEVRFVQSGRIHEAVVRACRRTIAGSPWVADAPSPMAGGEGGTRGGAPEPAAATYRPGSDRPAGRVAEPAATGPRYGVGGGGSPAPAPGPREAATPPARELDLRRSEDAEAPGFFGRMRVIGQAGRTFVLCESDGALHVIDQHAAHERVAYERIKGGWERHRLPRQQLLLPVHVELGARESAAVQDHLDVLEHLGFALEPFGGATWQVTSVPGLLADADVEELVRDVVGELVDVGRTRLAGSQLDHLFATMACHSVVRAGEALTSQELRGLLEAMDETDASGNCPHGRPVLLTMPFDELARRFHRS